MWKASTDQPGAPAINAAVARIVNGTLTAALATATDDGPWVWTVYVAFRGNRFWFTSQDSTRHVAAMRKTPAVGVAMWRAPVAWGEKLLGLQLAGQAAEVLTQSDAESGLEVLHEKFPGTLETLPTTDTVMGKSKRTCLFMVECHAGSVRDEENIGKGRFPILWSPE